MNKTASELKHILITGAPGSGKTTLSNKLKEETGLPVIGADSLPSSPGQPYPGTEELRQALSKLKKSHIVEGVQVMGLKEPELRGHDLKVLNPASKVLVKRLIERGWDDEKGKTRHDRKGAEELIKRFKGYLKSFITKSKKLENKTKEHMNKTAFLTGYMEKTASLKSQEAIFGTIKKLLPPDAVHSSGGLPDARNVSDVDISLLRNEHHDMLDQFPEGTTADTSLDHTIYGIPGYDRPVNVYAGNDSNRVSRALKHRLNEIYLAEQRPDLAAEAAELKKKGLGTEEAWAQVLGLEGDPYETMLDRTQIDEILKRGTIQKTARLTDEDVSHYMKTYYESNHDKAHGPEHIELVRERMKELVDKTGHKKTHLADAAALLHDIGSMSDREHHEITGADIASKDKRLAERFSKKDLSVLINSIREHRASTGNPRSTIAKMLSDADRLSSWAHPGVSLSRAYSYGKLKEPSRTDDEQVMRAADHITNKYGPGGYGLKATYFPESSKYISKQITPIIEAYDKKDIKTLKAIMGMNKRSSLSRLERALSKPVKKVIQPVVKRSKIYKTLHRIFIKPIKDVRADLRKDFMAGRIIQQGKK